jgi:hypothetical protein
MFETYGDELKFVQGFDPAKVWTITSSGDYVVLGNGYHFVDRVGYLLSAAPCPGDEHYEIVIGEPDDELGEVDAMIEIQRLLDGEEWSPDTLDAIAEICRRAGYPVRDTSETTAE